MIVAACPFWDHGHYPILNLTLTDKRGSSRLMSCRDMAMHPSVAFPPGALRCRKIALPRPRARLEKL